MKPQLLWQEFIIPSRLSTSKEKCFEITLLKTSLVADVLSGWRFLGSRSSHIPPTLLLWAGLCFLHMHMLNPSLQELRGGLTLEKGSLKKRLILKEATGVGPNLL